MPWATGNISAKAVALATYLEGPLSRRKRPINGTEANPEPPSIFGYLGWGRLNT